MWKQEKKLHFKAPKTGEFNYDGFKVIISHPLPNQFNIGEAFRGLLKKVPPNYFQNLDCIYIGEFDFLESRELTAIYKERVFYVSNKQDNVDDLIDDLVHETAHLAEEDHTNLIYSDGKLEKEFLQKRKQLYDLIDYQGGDYGTNYSDFLNPEYDIAFDNYLYNTIGYGQLVLHTVNLFYSPYAVTSLREYFANGFEAFYFYRDIKKLKNLSPILYNKLTLLEEKIAN